MLRSCDAVEDRAPNQPEVAVDVVIGSQKIHRMTKLVDVADDDAIRRILPRHLDAVDEIGVVGEQHQQHRQLADVVLAVAVGVEDELLGRVREPAAQRRRRSRGCARA